MLLMFSVPVPVFLSVTWRGLRPRQHCRKTAMPSYRWAAAACIYGTEPSRFPPTLRHAQNRGRRAAAKRSGRRWRGLD